MTREWSAGDHAWWCRSDRPAEHVVVVRHWRSGALYFVREVNNTSHWFALPSELSPWFPSELHRMVAEAAGHA